MALSFDDEMSLASEEKRSQWVHRRLLIYCKVSIILSGVELAVRLIVLILKRGSFLGTLLEGSGVTLLPSIMNLIVFFTVYRRAKHRPLDRVGVIRYSFAMVLLLGLSAFLIRPVVGLFLAAPGRPPGLLPLEGRLLLIHFVAAAFIPWTSREALVLLAALSGLAVFAQGFFAHQSMGQRLTMVAVLPLAGLPGWFLCRLRYSRFRDKFALEHLTGRYRQLQRELEQARAIHEMLFPGEITEGGVQLRYAYEPMQQIGGDYLYVHHDGAGRISVVVLDVTGHGITAALTVNRIYGELDRLFGEREDRTPGEILYAMNRYFCVSLARMGIFATGVSLRVDGSEERLEWANAGHPPPFVLAAKAGCLALNSNAMMLGVLDNPDYECSTEVCSFSHGDRVVVYTDGVMEAHDKNQQMFGIEGCQQVLLEKAAQSANSKVSDDLLEAVRRFRAGPAEDDSLIVELTRHVVEDPIEEGAAVCG